ncbi:D-ribose pyranase [Psychromonas sp. B3M02]|uniref:D-ribose pyranase n=1 Tax=unclassified Psychromonas TaxID=2614957 RepID=UPI000DE8B213|nr:D-ribose pyranase [Psychromonas sp. B3M02]RBW47567.1 D-ribose pyranase [Psychromonas sp. B3M02]
MKKSALLNAQLSHCIASLGHFDEVTICDAGLPIPNQVERIDLALTHGVPSFLDTVEVVLSEMQITGIILAEEIKNISPVLHQALLQSIEKQQQSVDLTYLSHEEFKAKTVNSKAVVRTGECTPFANVIFQSGVVF